MKASIFDTNVAIDFTLHDLLKSSPARDKNVDLFIGCEPEERIVPLTVLTEYSTVMLKVVHKEHDLDEDLNLVVSQLMQKFIDEVEDFGVVYYPDSKDKDLAVEIYIERMVGKKWSRTFDFADALLISVAINNAFELVTNDKELKRVYSVLQSKNR